MGLPQNLLRDERLIVGDDAPGVDNLKRVAAPVRLAIDTIAGDARLVGHNGAARAGEAIEKSGLADIWAAHNHQRCWSLGHGCEQWSMARNRSDDAILDCIAFAAKPTGDHRWTGSRRLCNSRLADRKDTIDREAMQGQRCQRNGQSE